MPLLRRRPVPLLPVPEFDEQSEGKDPQVYYLKATGEIFKDYEAYAARLTFFLTRQFQCEYSGKTNLDYFSALASEKQESRIVRERFPDVLKGRVLATVQFRVMGRLDSLVDLVFERYKDRYFPDEQCFIDIQGDKYLAKIVRVFPPQSVRDAAFAEQQAAIAAAAAAAAASAASPAASTSANPDGAQPPQRPVVAPLDYDAIAHRLGCDLNVDAKKARTEDNPEEYLYTLQLMDEQYRFEGSSMEVHARQLSRDRLTFSKSIMKRYLRECLVRDAAIGSPWTVKPSIARMFGIPERQSDTVEERNREAKEAKLAKRRKTNPDGSEASSSQGPTKRRKTEGAKTPRTSTPSGEADAPKERKAPEPRAKAIKYPIEDLELDPMSIHDGRVLRRVNTDLPPLPPKPQPKRTLPVPRAQFDRFVETWNALNIFAKPLNLSTFSMDDYAGALAHDTLSPRCILLVEIHASLTNVLGTDGSRVLGSTTAVPSRRPAGGAAAPVASTHEDENEDQLDPDHPVSDSTPAPGAESVQGGGGGGDDQLDGDEIPYEESELNKLVRLGIAYAKRWDRQAKLKYAEGREGWERHLVGALCQRGGPIHMPNFVRIMRHLFAGHPELPEQDVTAPDELETGGKNGENGANGDGDGDGDVKPGQTTSSEANGTATSEAKSTRERTGAAAAQSGSRQSSREPQDGGDPTDRVEQHYLSLSLEDKLDIIAYLVTLVMGTKVVRTYIEESELRLTELRKQRADVNKERKALLEQKAIQDNGGVPPKANGAAKAAGTPATQQNGDASTSNSAPATPATSNGAQAKASVQAEDPQPTRSATPAAAAADDEEEDQLASDDDASSVAASEAGSTANLSRRQAVLEEKRLEKLRGGRSSSVASSSGGRRQSGASATLSLEEQLRLNSERDDETEREFRRYLGVTRCRPLGRDRFHCRYWWFDGIGGMNLAGTGKGEVAYGTGRLFVQGPSVEDWELICDSRKEEGDGIKSMLERRMREEVVDDPSALLGPDEWAYYEDEDELENLNNWLNAKGTRELALKNALAKWRPFIIAGAKKRQYDAAHPDLPRYDFGGRRSSRKDPVAEIANTYLGWRNSNAKF